MTLTIVADANMPLVEELFAHLGTVIRVQGRDLKNKDLLNADVLLVRSVTQVNKELLSNTPIKFVGTATIGTDHIDEDYLQQQNIGFSSAQGCNANSVAEYILSTLVVTGRLRDLVNQKQRLAIVGAGNVGSRLAFFAKTLGFDFGCYDPPLKKTSEKKYDWNWIDWQQVLTADVISIHVPITDSGNYPTKHMFAAEQLSRLKQGSLLINSARGAVVDNKALLQRLLAEKDNQANNPFQSVLDVWENEPDIDSELQQSCIFGSPHIAGYSKDGKQKGTKMLYIALLKFLNLTSPTEDKSIAPIESIEWISSLDFIDNLTRCILKSYDLRIDSDKLKLLNNGSIPEKFDLLRKQYPDRLEFNHYSILNTHKQFSQQLQQLGFDVRPSVVEK